MAKKDEADKKEKELSATAIVGAAEKAAVQLFHNSVRECWATFPVQTHWETWPIKSPEFQDWLSAMCHREHHVVPNGNPLSSAVRALAGRALYDSPKQEVHARIAIHGESIYLDLGNDSWQAAKISSEGWEIVTRVPVKFRRTPGMQPLPHPIRGGTIEPLRSLVNLENEDQWILLIGWLLGAFRPGASYPLLVLEGAHGSAKTFCAKVARGLVDPNTAPLRAEPGSARDLAISASNTWCLGYDNLSDMPPWFSDALCRLSTGGGFATRALWTDSGEKIFEGTHPVTLNGIEIGIDRGDLLDRCICLSLPVIEEEKRGTETELLTSYEKLRPLILGALLDVVACALRNLPATKLARLPRMADFATWVTAAEPALGWSPGTFVEAYERNREESNGLALAASCLVGPIVSLAQRGPWEGTATDLLSSLTNELLNCPPQSAESWPRSAKNLSEMTRRLVPNLRKIGLQVKFSQSSGSDSKRMISIRKSDDGSETGTACATKATQSVPLLPN